MSSPNNGPELPDSSNPTGASPSAQADTHGQSVREATADSAGSSEGGASPEVETALEPSIAARLADAEARAAEYMDLALRARADLDNLRKRSQAELAAAHKYAVEGFAESLLPVRDSLEMALHSESASTGALREGVSATLRLLAAAFDRHKLQAIDPVGERFDPNRHQAISMVSEGEVPAQHVVSVLQKGYLINDRVLRPALVTVRAGS